MKKIYALFMTLCLVLSATAAPLAGTVKGSYPLNTKVVTSAKQLSLDATMQKAPAATQGLQYDATEGDLIRYYNESDALSIDTTYASEGQLSIRIVASDNSDLLSLVLFAESTVPGTIIPEGTYPITSEPAYGTAYASPGVQNGSVYPSFYGMLNANGQILTPLYFLESGNVVVEVVDGNLKISIDAANSNNVPMTIVYEVGGKSEKVEVKGPLKYDATEGALDVTYGADATVQLSNGDGYSILTVASPDATNEVDLAFFYDAADPETVIPAGTYTIDESYTSGTVLASTGVNSQGQVSLSFYANLNEEGNLVTPIYFLVSGTVEVTNVDGNLKVEVNAVNSNDVPIHIVYDATPAEEEEVTVPTNAELWGADNTDENGFMYYFNEYYGLKRATQTLDNAENNPVATFTTGMDDAASVLTDPESKYKWLGDYILMVTNEQIEAGKLSVLKTLDTNVKWRYSLQAFFLCSAATDSNYKGWADFTEAGKPENWGPYYLAAQGGTTEPEYALEETVEISNLTTETLTVGDVTYLQLTGRNDMLDSDVQLFLNNYTGEDKEYEVNAENSLMTFGGIELTVVEGTIAQTTDPEKGQVYTGRVIASAEEEGEVMLVALDLVMYAAPAVELEIIDAVARVDEETGALVLTAEWTDTVSMVTYPVFITVAGYNEADLDEYGFVEYEGAQISELQIGDDDNWLDFAVANAVAILKDGNVVGLEAEYTSWATGATYYVYAEGVMQGGETSEYDVYEDAITNLVIDYDNMLLIGGPSEAFQVEVVLGLGDYDRNTDAFQLLPASTISVLGSEATFIDGVASVDGIAQTATAVVHCTWNGMALEFHLTMSATPLEPTVVVVENAVVEIEKVLLFGDMYDYALKMTGVWTNEGIDYPVLVEVPVYYPEATEPSEIYSTVTVGGWEDDDPWLGFGEGTLTVTTVDNVITATGIVQNPGAGIAIDITISGTIVTTGLENATVTVKPVKVLKNGQLIIEKDGVQYNAQGAILK